MVANLFLALFLSTGGVVPSKAKTGAEVSAFFSQRDADLKEGRKVGSFIFSVSPEYSFDFVSFWATLPVVLREGNFLVSDIGAGAKVSLPLALVTPTFGISFEFPSGTTPVTSKHFEVMPWVLLSLDFPVLSFEFFGGWRRSVFDLPESSTNVVFPHTSQELSAYLGAEVKPVPLLKGGVRLGGVFEDMSEFVFYPELFVRLSFDAGLAELSLTARGGYYFSGVRKGIFAGVSGSVSF